MSTFRFIHRLTIVLLFVGLLGTSAAADENSHRARGPAGTWLRKLQRLRPSTNERNHPQVKEAFREVVHDARLSTVRVLCDDLQVALGAIVDPRGYVLTKDSELHGKIQCLLMDGRRLKAQMVARRPDFDLALLKILGPGLPAVEWSDSAPGVGAWLATTGLIVDAKAIGVISTPPRVIPSPRAALGVTLEASNAGPRITNVISGSGAAKASLRRGDVILDVDGRAMTTPNSVTKAVSQHRPGDQIVVQVRRGERVMSISAVLGDRARLLNEQAEIMETLGGPLSNRRNGFPIAIQHDTVLRPRDCGGPLVDLTGKVVGINIARASRVASYAIPAETIQSLLPAMLAQELVATQTAATEAQLQQE